MDISEKLPTFVKIYNIKAEMKRLNLLWCVAFVAMVMTAIGCSKTTDGPTQGIITVENGQFMRNGEPYPINRR